MSEERRLVEVQFQRFASQLVTLSVSVPATWTDEDIKARLSEIYEKATMESLDWTDQDDTDHTEGTHELTSESKLQTPDLVFPQDN